MICDRCDQPIRPRQAYETRGIDAASGPGAVVYLHKKLCRRPEVKDYPVPALGPRWDR